MTSMKYNRPHPDKKRKENSESDLTAGFSHFFYYGVGDRYLGYHVAVKDLQPDGSWANGKRYDKKYKQWFPDYDHPEHWEFPQRQRSSILLKHLQGHHRGLVATHDSGCTHVPFLAVDLDRHHGEDRLQHLQRVIKVGRLCVRMFPELRWVVEINPHKGSAKVFGLGRKNIGIATARQMAEQLHQAVVQITGNPATEVFPHNLTQVMLPLRQGKITIVSTGQLGKVERTKNKPTRQKYETYSLIAFRQWWLGFSQYCETTLRNTLQAVLQLDNRSATSPISNPIITQPVNRLDALREEAYREAIGLDVISPSMSFSPAGKPMQPPLGGCINCGLGPVGVVLSPSPTAKTAQGPYL